MVSVTARDARDVVVWSALDEVADPEIPAVSVVELGVIGRFAFEPRPEGGEWPQLVADHGLKPEEYRRILDLIGRERPRDAVDDALAPSPSAEIVRASIAARPELGDVFLTLDVKDLDALVGVKDADDFRVHPPDRLEFAGPIRLVVRPADPSGVVLLPLTGHRTAEREIHSQSAASFRSGAFTARPRTGSHPM